MKIIFCFPFPGFNKSQQELRLYLYPISIGVMRWWEIGLISILHPPSHTLISTGPKGAEFLPHPSSTRQDKSTPIFTRVVRLSREMNMLTHQVPLLHLKIK
jgi:hypothetical protein